MRVRSWKAVHRLKSISPQSLLLKPLAALQVNFTIITLAATVQF
jgi:hypothetical protein